MGKRSKRALAVKIRYRGRAAYWRRKRAYDFAYEGLRGMVARVTDDRVSGSSSELRATSRQSITIYRGVRTAKLPVSQSCQNE